MHIRTASLADAAALAAVEAACFPPAEAATAAEITDRLAYYADHFWAAGGGRRHAGELCGRHDHRRAHAPGRDV